MTFAATATTTSGFAVGDVVDVTYGHGRAASSVEYVEHRASGTVTSSGQGQMTIINGATGRSETFLIHAAVATGGRVVVVYHRSASGLVADDAYALESLGVPGRRVALGGRRVAVESVSPGRGRANAYNVTLGARWFVEIYVRLAERGKRHTRSRGPRRV